MHFEAFHPARPDLVRPVRLDPRGERGPTAQQARGSAWRRSSFGFYLPAWAGDSVDQRIAEASVFLRGLDAVTGWAGLRWLRAHWFDGNLTGRTEAAPVPVLTSTTRAPQPGFEFSEERISYGMFLEHEGLNITDPWRSTAYAMRYAASVRAAVVALDMACAADLVSLDEMGRHLALLNGWTGIPQARQAWPLADENSWSPQESVMRLVWMVDCGYPRPLCNSPIFDLRGNHLLTPDLFDPEAGVIGEYDGIVHLADKRRRRDRDRQELARDFRLEHFTVMSGDMPSGRAVQQMLAARSRAHFDPPEGRPWTVEPPPWWRPTTTVAQRRALTESDRDRLLGRRAS